MQTTPRATSAERYRVLHKQITDYKTANPDASMELACKHAGISVAHWYNTVRPTIEGKSKKRRRKVKVQKAKMGRPKGSRNRTTTTAVAVVGKRNLQTTTEGFSIPYGENIQEQAPSNSQMLLAAFNKMCNIIQMEELQKGRR